MRLHARPGRPLRYANAMSSELRNEPEGSPHSTEQRSIGARGLRVLLLWLAMVSLFVFLWHWVGPGSLQ